MQHAPSVTYPVGRSRFLARALIVLWLAGALVTFAWAASPGVLGWRLAGAAGLVLVSGHAAWRTWRDCTQGLLRWDGADWRFGGTHSDDAPPGLVTVALDLQRYLLLAIRPQEGVGRQDRTPQWLWLERRHDPARWHALRCAVYSAAPTADRLRALGPDSRVDVKS